MNKYILYNPAISSLNKGDEIISESCQKHLSGIIKDEDFTCEICTHLPIVNYYLRILGEPTASFVLGSNLLGGKMNRRFKQWYVAPKNLNNMKNIVLMGVGWREYNERPNLFTKNLYRRLLGNQFIHSVRDEYTKTMLESMGITNVINTGCPTMWSLTKDHCAMIPTKKSDTVVFTLTDYRRNETRDRALIDTLIENYNNIYFWIQGSGDDAYFDSLTSQMQTEIIKINPSLAAYQKFLDEHDCDYVGTRLHAGIKALQCRKRSVIIGVDNRAIEIERDYNIVCLHEKDISSLDRIINSEIKTDIHINGENIKTWLGQFEKAAGGGYSSNRIVYILLSIQDTDEMEVAA